jgi:7,8-dihydropterin-6-yl-methyl-4-(beta-D-ribofuranosyl)aminobenzene 5'-phosphate synthase
MTEPIQLEPVDRVEILTIVDNVVDLLLPTTDVAKRMSRASPPPQVEAPLLESGRSAESPVAEHGLALAVSVSSNGSSRSLLLDTGSTVNGLVHNLRALGVDPGEFEIIVLSHGHFDHTAGLNGLVARLQSLPPLLAHPDCWLKRRMVIPGRKPFEMPATSREKVQAAGFELIEERGPTPLLGGAMLVTGQIERTTEFEQGFPVQQALREGQWEPDPLIQDDQALVANLRGKGLVIITGCGHAGVVNTVRYARKLTGVERVHAVIGGFHLANADQEQVLQPTVEALKDCQLQVLVPTHCTGWRAVHALAAALPEAFIQGSVGTRYVLEGNGG